MNKATSKVPQNRLKDDIIQKGELMQKLSIIVPCYNEEKALPLFFVEIDKYSKELAEQVEYVFVNDGSKDNTLNVLKSIKEEYPNQDIKIVDFSRNFGKEAGILAGLKTSTGDYVVIMDADMQDPPFLLPRMLETIKTEEYDSVATYRVDRKGEPPIRSFFARKFYQLINQIGRASCRERV